MEWIDVSYALPGNDRYVFTCSKGIESVAINFYSHRLKSWSSDGVSFPVSHWMELPEIPK